MAEAGAAVATPTELKASQSQKSGFSPAGTPGPGGTDSSDSKDLRATNTARPTSYPLVYNGDGAANVPLAVDKETLEDTFESVTAGEKALMTGQLLLVPPGCQAQVLARGLRGKITDPVLATAFNAQLDIAFVRVVDGPFAGRTGYVWARWLLGLEPPLESGQITSDGAGDDGKLQKGLARSYTDNGDGTITDKNTGLMWEKKDQSGGIHDWGNTYSWAMEFGPYAKKSTMVTTFLATLNTVPCFARHCDWRIPNVHELQSLAKYLKVKPAVDQVFNTSCRPGCTVLTCSCTQPRSGYWSSTTSQEDSGAAWAVYFDDGSAHYGSQTSILYVRAVRDGTGGALAYVDNGDGTITDLKTHLIWEKLSNDGGIHDYDNTYTWDQALARIATLNSGGGFAGHTDWRLPTREALQSLAKYEGLNPTQVKPAVDQVFNTSCHPGCTVLTCSCTQSYYYWSSTTYQGLPGVAWAVSFADGKLGQGLKFYTSYNVRAVRGGTGGALAYVDNGDGTITDPETHLIWEKLSNDGSIHDYDNTYTWDQALARIATLNSGGGFAGHTDWHLPTREALQSIVKAGGGRPTVDGAFNANCVPTCTVMRCSCTQSNYYWSSTTYQDYPDYAWGVSFYDGSVDGYFKDFTYYVRAVRGGS